MKGMSVSSVGSSHLTRRPRAPKDTLMRNISAKRDEGRMISEPKAAPEEIVQEGARRMPPETPGNRTVPEDASPKKRMGDRGFEPPTPTV